MGGGKVIRFSQAYQTLAFLTDMICLAAAFLPAVYLRFGRLDAYPFSAYAGTWAFYALWLFVFSTVETLYAFRTSMNRTMYSYRMIRLVLVTTALFALTLFLVRSVRGVFIDSRIIIVLHMFFWALLGITGRIVVLPWLYVFLRRVFFRSDSRALLTGSPKNIGRIASLIRKAPVYRNGNSLVTIPEPLPKNPDEIFAKCRRLCLEHRCDQLYLLFDRHDLNCVAETCVLLHDEGCPFVIYSPHIRNLGYFDPWLSLENHGAVSFLKRGRATKNDVPARLLDIGVSLAGLVVLSPLLALVAVMVKLSGAGPVLFKQTRVGLGCREFQFLKFRSMTHDVTGLNSREHKEYFARYARGYASGKPDSFKLDQRNRITPVGRLLRKTSLDELPQLINVLKGDMTLVGPRPCIPYELEFYRSWQKRRFTVKPGLTGIWQVYGRSRLPFDHAQFLDFLYTIDMSYSLDFRLIMKTLPVMLMGKGGV